MDTLMAYLPAHEYCKCTCQFKVVQAKENCMELY